MDESFRLGIDPIPDWFMDLVTHNRAMLHSKEWREIETACISNNGPIQCAHRGQRISRDAWGRVGVGEKALIQNK